MRGSVTQRGRDSRCTDWPPPTDVCPKCDADRWNRLFPIDKFGCELNNIISLCSRNVAINLHHQIPFIKLHNKKRHMFMFFMALSNKNKLECHVWYNNEALVISDNTSAYAHVGDTITTVYISVAAAKWVRRARRARCARASYASAPYAPFTALQASDGTLLVPSRATFEICASYRNETFRPRSK